MPRLARLFIPMLVSICLASACDAGVAVSARFGWGDRFRPDRWTPAYVTATADQPTAAVIEWYVPRPGREAMVIRQDVTLNPGGSTFPAYLPVGPDPAAIHVRVADAESGRTLGFWPERLPSPVAYDDAQVRTPVFVGTSGESPSLRFLDGEAFTASYLPPRDLPRRAIGYDGLDVLMLDRPDVAGMEIAQQKAIVAWVRAGGRLVLWLGINPVPADAPLNELLPARVVDFTTRPMNGGEVPFVRLEGVGDDRLVTTAERGLGRVIFLHAPPDSLHAAGVSFVPDQPRPTWMFPAVPSGPAAARRGPGRPTWLWPALAVAALVGPIDWLLLRRTRRRVRPWATLPGWVALFALLALYLPSDDDRGMTVVLIRPDEAAATATLVGGQELSDKASRDAVAALEEVGPIDWRTAGPTRTAGPLRDVGARQGDGGMPLPLGRPKGEYLTAEATALPH